MAPNIDDYLVFLRENASEIKSLGKQWGMSEDEILNCVNEVLSRSPNIEKKGNAPFNLARKLWRSFACVLMLSACAFLMLVVAILAFSAVLAYHPPAADYFSKAMQPRAYPVMRFFRLAALPFHDFVNVTQFYESECIIDNPFFVGEPQDCRPCSIFKKIKEADADTFPADKFHAYMQAFKPVLLKKTYDKNITYPELRKAYQEDKDGIAAGESEFFSSDPAVPSLSVLFDVDKEDLLSSSDSLQIHWAFNAVPTMVLTRDLFPQPHFLPEHVNIIQEKHILLHSPKSGTFQLPESIGPGVMYTQAQGRRRILLRPVEACKSECSSLLAIMEAGDCLVFSGELYNMFLSANGDTLSIGYMEQFTAEFMAE